MKDTKKYLLIIQRQMIVYLPIGRRLKMGFCKVWS